MSILKIFLTLVLFSVVTLAFSGGDLQEVASKTTIGENGDDASREEYWTCYAIDSEDHTFSGWDLNLAKAKKNSIENCSTYSDTGSDCSPANESCEKIEI